MSSNFIINEFLTIKILSFLPFFSLIPLRRLSHSFDILIRQTSYLYTTLVLNPPLPPLQLLLTLYANHQPILLSLNDPFSSYSVPSPLLSSPSSFSSTSSPLVLLFSIPNPRLKTILLNIQLSQVDLSFLLFTLSENCPFLSSFTSSNFYDECFCILANFDALNFLNLPSENGLLYGKELSRLKPLKELKMRAYNLEWEELSVLLKNSQEIMEKLSLDCENVEFDDLGKIVSRMKKLQSLSLFHCEKADNNLFQFFKGQRLQKLEISKAGGVGKEGWDRLFKENEFDLLEINLEESYSVEDEVIILIVERNRKLRRVNISWCWEVTSKGVAYIFEKCILEKASLRGLKKIDDEAFPEGDYYDFLKELDLTSCDFVGKKGFERVRKGGGRGIILDYYGKEV